MTRRAGRTDANQADIVADLRRIPGCSVAVTSSLGKGYPDILVGFRGLNFWIELKNPKTARGQKPDTRARQESFRAGWHGQLLKASSFKEILDCMLYAYIEDG